MIASETTVRRERSSAWAERLAQPLLMSLVLALLTMAVFWSVKDHQFVNLDDPEYFTSNPRVQHGLTPNGVSWALTTGHASNWHPLTWMSHMLDASLFGADPAGPHVVNLLFHAANTVLLFLLLRSLAGAHWKSAFVAALFALHPLHVESVAWVAERKDVLSAFFGLLTLHAYVRYVRESEFQSAKAKRLYGAALVLFALGLMSKPMLVTLPFVLLLLDYWPLRRVSRVWPSLASCGVAGRCQVSGGEPAAGTNATRLAENVLEKIPFFLLTLASSVITMLAQRKYGAVGSLAHFPLGSRIENAIVAYGRYLAKMFWPVHLAVPYPHPGHWPMAEVLFAAAVILALTVAAVGLRRRAPFLFVGWLWFVGMLVPVIGLVQVGSQSLADRYTYLPLIGLFIVFTWGAEAILVRIKLPRIAAVAAGLAIVGVCSVRTFDQLRHWQDSETLFRHALQVTQNNWLAHDNLGFHLYQNRKINEAMEHYRRALEINPGDYIAYDSIGFHSYNLGRLDEALGYFRKSLQLNSNNPTALNNLGSALAGKGQFTEAINAYEAALRLRPDYSEAHINLGAILDSTGKPDLAIQHYTTALDLTPHSAQAHNNLANALVGRGLLDDAIAHYQRALVIDPQLAAAWNNLGWALTEKKQYTDAVACYERLLQLNNIDPRTRAQAHVNLGDLCIRLDRRDEAIGHFAEALKLRPEDVETRRKLESLGSAPK